MSPKSHSLVLLLLAYFAHLALVGLHATLLYVGVHHLEHNITMSLGAASSRASVLVVIISQTFVTLYSAALLLLVQQLSQHHILLSSTTLTQLHDLTSAWTGLGSAFSTLMDQFRLSSAVWGLMVILGYLGALAGLHITTPALFGVEVYNQTTPITLSAVSSIPAIDNLAEWGSVWTTIGTLLPALSYDDLSISRAGLSGNTLYDVISPTSSTGTANVSAISLDVRCAPFHPAEERASKSIRVVNRVQWSYFSINSTDGDKVGFFPTGSGFLRFAQPVNSSRLQEMFAPARITPVLFGANFTDSNGASSPTRFSVVGPLGANNLENVTVSAQALSCGLGVVHHSVEVDLQTKLLTSPPSRRSAAYWNDTSTPEGAYDPLAAWASTLWTINTTVGTGSGLNGLEDTIGSSVTEGYVLQAMGLVDLVLLQNGSIRFSWITSPDKSTDLLSFEQTTEDLLALIMWMVTALSTDFQHSATQVEGTTVILQSRLNLSMLPVIAGTVISALLFCCHSILTWPTRAARKATHDMLDGMGVLQILWLSGREPSAAYQLASEIDKPSLKHLRRLGADLSLWSVPSVPDEKSTDQHPLSHIRNVGEASLYDRSEGTSSFLDMREEEDAR